MEDNYIIDLFWSRDEKAIQKSDKFFPAGSLEFIQHGNTIK